MSDERVWLRHVEHGGTFHCPVDAAKQWQGMGWEPCDEPEEHNPVIAEMLAAQRAAAQQAEPQPLTDEESDTTPQES